MVHLFLVNLHNGPLIRFYCTCMLICLWGYLNISVLLPKVHKKQISLKTVFQEVANTDFDPPTFFNLENRFCPNFYVLSIGIIGHLMFDCIKIKLSKYCFHLMRWLIFRIVFSKFEYHYVKIIVWLDVFWGYNKYTNAHNFKEASGIINNLTETWIKNKYTFKKI